MRSVDKPNKDFVVNNMTIDLDVLGALTKGGGIHGENGGLIITVYRHSLLYDKTKLFYGNKIGPNKGAKTRSRSLVNMITC